MNVNANTSREPKGKRDYRKTFASQRNITKHHDTSRETYFHAGRSLNKKYSRRAIDLLIVTFQSHPNKMGCCNTITKSLIVTTINPIWRSRPVHHGTKIFTICSLKSKEKIIFAHNCFKKQNTNQASHCFDFYFSIFFLVKGLGT